MGHTDQLVHEPIIHLYVNIKTTTCSPTVAKGFNSVYVAHESLTAVLHIKCMNVYLFLQSKEQRSGNRRKQAFSAYIFVCFVCSLLRWVNSVCNRPGVEWEPCFHAHLFVCCKLNCLYVDVQVTVQRRLPAHINTRMK